MIDRNKLENIYEAYRQDPSFEHLRVGQNKLIPGEGANDPIAFILGEAPGAEEAMRGRPFVGASGKILRQLMLTAELHSDASRGKHLVNCWLTNTVKYRPLRNRTPTLKEIKDSRSYIKLEHKAVGRPKIIIPVGSVAFHAIMGQPRSILDAAGKRLPFLGSRGTWFTIWPMLHPAYGLRNPAIQPEMERHWKELGVWLRKSRKV